MIIDVLLEPSAGAYIDDLLSLIVITSTWAYKEESGLKVHLQRWMNSVSLVLVILWQKKVRQGKTLKFLLCS